MIPITAYPGRTIARAALVLILGLANGCAQGPPIGGAAADAPLNGQSQAEAGVVYDDLLTAGRTVIVRAGVEGDVAAAGANVTIAGPVSGYVMSAGRMVSVDGRIGNDLWAAGETVDVGSDIGNNAMVAGRTVRLRPAASVGQDASLAGEHVTTEGTIQHDLKIGASTAEIGGEVGGTVEAHAARVSVLPGAVIRGDLIVDAPEPPDISPQAQILGQVRHEPGSRDGNGWMAWPTLWLLSFAALLVLGLAAVAFSPSWAAHVTATMRQEVGRSLVAGLLWLVVTPVVVGLLLITVVGIPLALVLLAFYGVVLLLAAVFVAYRVGNWVFERGRDRPTAAPWLRMAIGVLIVSLGMSLPVVGWAIVLAVMLFGAGAIVIERRSIRTPAVAQP